MNLVTRVMVLGGSGTGKSWLAMRLAALAGLPAYHMDQLSWMPGFVHRSTGELDALTREIHAQEHWIIEGGHYETMHERAARAHLLIWVDPSRPVQVARVAWRSLRYHNRTRPGMGEGCRETFGWHTLDAIAYARTSRQFHRDRATEVIAAAGPRLALAHIRSGWQARRFLRRCAPVPRTRGFLLQP